MVGTAGAADRQAQPQPFHSLAGPEPRGEGAGEGRRRLPNGGCEPREEGTRVMAEGGRVAQGGAGASVSRACPPPKCRERRE